MRTKFVETTQSLEGGFNHGKFAVGRFDADEGKRPSRLDEREGLLRRCGWTGDHALVLDLATGEGAVFLPGGLASADLNKHRIWVCPMFEPFLEWLYAWRREAGDRWFLDLPDLVELPGAPLAMSGYRRAGRLDWNEEGFARSFEETPAAAWAEYLSRR